MKKLIFKYGFELEIKVPDSYSVSLLESELITVATIGQDSSIQATENQTPLEIRSDVGGKKRIFELTDKITEKLKRIHATVNQSCGYHLHVSNKNFFVKRNLNRIVFFWCAIEDVLISTQPRSRYHNEYCRRKLEDLLYDDPENLPSGKRVLIQTLTGKNRYFALNLQALQRHGTIEIRLHAGTINPEKIKKWVELITAFFYYALQRYNHEEVLGLFNMKISDEKILRTFELLNLSPEVRKHFLERIEKFGFERLAQEQEVAIEFVKFLPSYRQKVKRMERLKKNLQKEQSKLESIRSNFRKNTSHSENNCNIPGCSVHNSFIMSSPRTYQTLSEIINESSF